MQGNFHTHTKRCKHAIGDEIDYVKEAVKNNLKQLGFSDHAPFPNYDYGYRMQFEELPEYLQAIDDLKLQYPEIELFKGVEIEYHPQYINFYKELFDVYGMDYLALGEHNFTVDGENKNIFIAQSTKDYIEYAENIAEAVETGFFKFLAHPDVMFVNQLPFDKNCEKACDIILRAAEKTGIILELNANGLRRGLKPFPDGIRFAYPHDYFWKQLSGSNQRVIIGSDCHTPQQMCDEFTLVALNYANRMNLNLVDTIF